MARIWAQFVLYVVLLMSSELTINSNIAALQAQRRLGQNSAELNRVFERLSSGQRINRASDDAAGLAISESLRADARVLSQGVRNLNDGISLLSIGEGALAELTNIVTRVRELAEQSANGTLGASQRLALDKEAQQLSKEYTRIAQTAQFNGIKIFDGSISSLQLQAGYGSAGGVIASIGGSKGDGTFNGSSSYLMEGTTSSAITLGDLNGDGISDVVTAGTAAGAGWFTVRLGTGTGTYGAALSYSAESSSSSAVALADLNGDGILDIGTAGSGGGGWATVRLGQGDGTFGGSKSYSVASNGGLGLAFGDVNSDGIMDLVGAGASASGTVSVWYGAGDGTFRNRVSFTAESGQTNAVSIADLNGDGRQDIITGGSGGGIGRATVFLGAGAGSFNAGVSYQMEGQSTAATSIADINGDEILDLITAGSAGGVGFATTRLGAGDGSFSTAVSYLMDLSGSKAVKIGDQNGDGIPDLITAGSGGGTGKMQIRLGNGGGTFGASVSYQTEASTSGGLALADVNYDGVLDVLSAGSTGAAGAFTIQLGTSTSGVGALLSFSLQSRQSALSAMGDLDRSLKRISAHRGFIGAFQSRVNSAINNVQISVENFAAAESQIRDADVAQEAANLAKGSILQNAAAAVLGQANLEPQIALSLLRG